MTAKRESSELRTSVELRANHRFLRDLYQARQTIRVALTIHSMVVSESDKRYEVVVKHCYNGLLHIGSFNRLEKARAYLMDRWANLRIERHLIQINCGGAIYDGHNSWKRVFMVGAPYLTDERPHRNKRN
jgi:hypothetical protein